MKIFFTEKALQDFIRKQQEEFERQMWLRRELDDIHAQLHKLKQAGAGNDGECSCTASPAPRASSWEQVEKLRERVSDLEKLSDHLRSRLGTADIKIDRNRQTMNEWCTKYGGKVDGLDSALAYYSGKVDKLQGLFDRLTSDCSEDAER